MSNYNRIVIPEYLPFLLITDGVVFPGVTLKIPCRAEQNIAVVEQRLMNVVSLRNALIGIAFQRSSDTKNGCDIEGFSEIGVAAIVTQVVGTNWPRPSYTIQATGICRVKIGNILSSKPYIYAAVSQLDKFPGKITHLPPTDNETVVFLEDVKRFIGLLPQSMSTMQLKKTFSSAPLDYIVDLVGAVAESSYDEKLKVLCTVDLMDRVRLVHGFVKRQMEICQSLHVLKYKPPDDKGNGNFTVEVYPESVKVDDITKALISSLINRDIGPMKGGIGFGGDKGSKTSETENLEQKLKQAKMPPEVEKVAMEELRKMKMASPHEYPSIRQYLETMADLPWAVETNDTLDLQKARKDLDEDHYGLETVKKRILEYLAVKRMQNSLKGPILCFVGPPGVGKTSVARSIARTLGRKFHRIALGGISDQTDIRGFNRTYVSSMPGRIINGLKAVRARNPVFLLDEVDKIHSGIRGDPAAALLEVLDPEQNFQFVDHYVNVPFDLSRVLFIATANNAASIPAPLMDRMEVISIPGYTPEEKLSIAQKYLVPKQLKEHGLSEEHITIPEKSLKIIVQRYTREAGVRSFERKIGAIMRAVALKVAETLGSTTSVSSADSVELESTKPQRVGALPIIIDDQAVEDILGLPLYGSETVELLSSPGVAAGLAWTPFGGEIMYVEATKMDGEGKLTLTGQLGDIMKESARVALNWLRSHFNEIGITITHGVDLLERTDIHIHFPAGAIGKDGPSAGLTVLVALTSLFTNRCVRSDTAMTGEITLRGVVLPVGGVKEKLLAAHRAGFKRIILPKKNSRDAAEAISEFANDIEIVTVERIEDALNAAIDGGFPNLIEKSKL